MVDERRELVFYVYYAPSKGKTIFMYDSHLYYNCELIRFIWQDFMALKVEECERASAATRAGQVDLSRGKQSRRDRSRRVRA